MLRQAKKRSSSWLASLDLRKSLIAFLLGLMGWGGAFFAINISAPPVTLSFIWSYCFPLLAAMAYGARYGLIAGLVGLGALIPFFAWPANGWANTITAGLLLAWYAWQGHCAQVRSLKPAFWNHALFAQALFSVLYTAVMLAGFPLGVSSSVIRARAKAGLPIDHLVPGMVAEAIAQNRLYL